MIEGKYCLEYTYDTTLGNKMSIISLRVFDRRNGKYAHDGVVWFYNETDTAQLLLAEGSGYKKLPAGDYVIGIAISNNGLLGFSTKKKIEMHENTKTQINIYLGSSLQW